MMRHHQQQPRPRIFTRRRREVEPHELHHHTRARIQPTQRRIELRRRQIRHRPPGQADTHLDPMHQPVDIDRTRLDDLETPPTIILDQP
ncbi:hypothetical protein MLGJGCBP_03260 [Rhodococcus sp. T7]|nr:hypothetical protein MLGJGCBP_03260 [Rhodococcus sp. T7]